MEAIATRSIAGGALALSLLIGGWSGSRLTLDLADAVDVALAKRVDPDEAQRKALEREASYQDSEAYYQTHIDEAVARFELSAPSRQRLLEPNTFYHVASPGDLRTIEPGATLREAGLEIGVKIEEIKVKKRGVTTRTKHTLATLANVGELPLAYFLDMRSQTGSCQVRAIGRYNTMVLRPGERAEISVCSGEHAVEIVDLRIMEVTELGALWVSKVPPQAVGHDELGARSHFAGEGVPMCAEIPAVAFASRIDAGEVEWEDIVDFYSRHDCEHYRWWPGYRRISAPLERLPAMP
ncbi:hypothetical protein ENSA5_67700 [Enhygromyxa salina]|uniref:Uncharacterized protein n=1 Tax=Enhygromyxa salina TaxID=215803 RepID=A0A2S9XBB8_9BACT|nr:hypothetical protein [Enhygromyxa salina]PRP90152.1 hypothetical protein ENSA5_67700 [Enhygromyxa salina]